MVNLTKPQKVLLDELATADAAYRQMKAVGLQQLRAELNKKLEALDQARGALAHRCKLAGVPKSQIRQIGLQTSDPATLNNLLERTQDVGAIIEEAMGNQGAGVFEWTDRTQKRIRINYPGYRGPYADNWSQYNDVAHDGKGRALWPDVIKGVVEWSDAEGRWVVIEDGNETPNNWFLVTENGFPEMASGPLDVELQHYENRENGTLAAELDEWSGRKA